jgi:hypothetical protein
MRAEMWGLAVVLALPVSAQRGVVNSVSVSSATVQAGTPIDITVSGNNPCGAVRLDYGDGSERVTHAIRGIPTSIRHVYRQPGRYDIRAEGMGNCDGAAATSLRVTPAPGAPSPPPDRRERDEPAPGAGPRIRFQEMDENGDGVVTRAEWRGNGRSFRVHDRNDDGILSGDEVRVVFRDVTVKATERWTSTGIQVREGDVLQIQSSGTVWVSADPSSDAAPRGIPSARPPVGSPFPSRPIGGLVARVGDGAVLFVGDDRTLRAPATGELYLSVNDDNLSDNRGEFWVRIQSEPPENRRR